jgi:hypothetical protein
MLFHCRMGRCAVKAVSAIKSPLLAISLRQESSETQDRATPKTRRQGGEGNRTKTFLRCHPKIDRRPVYTHFDVYVCGFIDRAHSRGQVWLLAVHASLFINSLTPKASFAGCSEAWCSWVIRVGER